MPPDPGEAAGLARRARAREAQPARFPSLRGSGKAWIAPRMQSACASSPTLGLSLPGRGERKVGRAGASLGHGALVERAEEVTLVPHRALVRVGERAGDGVIEVHEPDALLPVDQADLIRRLVI